MFPDKIFSLILPDISLAFDQFHDWCQLPNIFRQVVTRLDELML